MTLRLDAGPNLELRLLEQQDAEDLFALGQANREHLQRWLPAWAEATSSMDECRSVIRHSLQRHAVGSGHIFGIRVRNGLVGMTGLTITAPWEGEVGYWLDAGHWGGGIATRAVRALTRYAFERQRLNAVRIICEPENLRAAGVPERLGFRIESRPAASSANSAAARRESNARIVYAMLARDWAKERSP